MSYIDGFVIPVPTTNKQAYLDSATKFSALLREHGALQVVECWGVDLPDGKVTDFKKAVQATPEESVVFSWILWPSKEVRDAATKRLHEDPRMNDLGMPFDGKRLIIGGFEVIFEAKLG